MRFVDHEMHRNVLCPNIFAVESWLTQPIKKILFTITELDKKKSFSVLR